MKKIALCGDSNGTTAYVTQPQSYCALIAQKLGFVSVANYAVSGYTSAQIKAQVTQAIAEGATFVMINAGTNDFSGHRTDPAEGIITGILANVTDMISQCKTASVDCLVMSPILPNDITQTRRHIDLSVRLGQLCANQGVDFLPLTELMLQKFDGGDITGWYTPEGWHGYSVWHQFVADLVTRRQHSIVGSSTTTLLDLQMQGADGSTTFVDSSPYARAITAIGNAHIQGNTAVFDGVGDALRIPDSNDFAFGNADWTIEAQVKFSVLGGIFLIQRSGTGDYFIFDYTGTNLRFQILLGSQILLDLQSAWSPVVGTSYKVKVAHKNNVYALYVDDVQIGTPIPSSVGMPNYAAPISVGAGDIVLTGFNGSISSLKITSG